MFGIAYLKAPPTRYVLRYQNGRLREQGAGLSFFYFPQTSTIAQVPVDSVDVPFVFNDTSADFQPLTVQGQLTYRVVDPVEVATLLDFTVNAHGVYVGGGPEALKQRLVNITQVHTHALLGRLPMRDALTATPELVAQLRTELNRGESVRRLGVEILDVSILQIRTSPEMTRALEAETRERLQQQADVAIYERRNQAVELERRVKENELSTEVAVEEKKRQIQETRMAAEIANEEQRAMLIDHRIENERKEADSRAYALEATLKPLQGADWKTLTAAMGSGDPRASIALAFRDLAENASKIGELNISPDLLNTLMKGAK